MNYLSCFLLLFSITHTLVAENPNLSFSKFTEALKKGRAAANTSLETFEEPWEDQLRNSPDQRQPSQLGKTSKQLEMQVVKYQVQNLKAPPKPTQTKPEPQNKKTAVKKAELKPTPKAVQKPKQAPTPKSKSLSERFENLNQEKKETITKTEEKSTPPPIKRTADKKSPLKIQVVKDKEPGGSKSSRKVQENKTEPTKIKNFKY